MKSLKDGLKLHAHAIKSGFTPTIFTCNQLIRLYSKQGLIREAHKLFVEMPERNIFTYNTIISAHLKNQNIEQAQMLFHLTPHKDLVTYNSMLSGYANVNGFEAQAINLFIEMQSANSHCHIDDFTLTTMLNLAAKLSVLSYGIQLHSFMVKTCNDKDGFSVSSLIDMYSKCGCFNESCKVFDGCSPVLDLVSKNAMVAACCRRGELEMAINLFRKNPDLNDSISWNTLISGFAQNGSVEDSIKLFILMVENGVQLNEHTLASILGACSSLKDLKYGKELHAWILKENMILNPFICSGIVNLYCKCMNMKYAQSVYASIEAENSFAISSMIVGYSSQGNLVEARRLFDSLCEKNSVVWTALFSGYVKYQQCEFVFELLREFIKRESTVSDGLILVNVLNASAIQAASNPGKEIHGYCLRKGVKIDEKLVSAMIDMYSKCGNIKNAKNIFCIYNKRDLVIYNVMISGYAHHGYENEAIQLYEELLRRKFRPDEITFVALLSACRHAGLVEMGENYFLSMEKEYNILPETDHYACMIDLYGRANKLEKAVEFLRKIPREMDAVMWGAVLNSCKTNRNLEFLKEAEEKLLRIEGDNGARYVQLANLYAAEEKWEEMGRVRRKMRGKEVKKFAGCSWVYVENSVNIFTSADISHSKSKDIYYMLNCLTAELDDFVVSI